MSANPILFLISTLGLMYISVVVLRFLLQLSGADYYNPISQSVVKISQPLLTPFQKMLPKVGRLDISPLVLGWILIAALLALLLVINGHALGLKLLLPIVIESTVTLIKIILQIYFFAVIGSVIISWVAPGSYHPAPQLIQQLTAPVFGLFQRIIPPIAGLDLSPIFIFLSIQLIEVYVLPQTLLL
jgi:YggT family protein